MVLCNARAIPTVIVVRHQLMAATKQKPCAVVHAEFQGHFSRKTRRHTKKTKKQFVDEISTVKIKT